ncbi:MAG TPA: thioester domain-containing protein, partial [Yinghuangia sp.]|nr:thioester domain-containing protein [Yinghuangia sp.]
MLRRQDRRTASRLSAIAAVSALAVGGTLALAAPAHAEGVKGTYKGFADVDGDNKGDSVGLALAGHKDKIGAGLMSLELETGETLLVYCVDFGNPTSPGNKYQEGEWGSTWPSGADAAERRAKIKWVLLNSYPTKSVEDLKTAANVPGLDVKEAAAATQAAIWHFSDKVDLKDDEQKDITELYKYLIGKATAADNAEPKISLELDPTEQSGVPSATPGIGPFTVKTNAQGKAIDAALGAGAPEGTKLVDKDGNPVTKAGNGDELYVKPAAGSDKGSATVEVSGTSKLDAGRIFNGKNQHNDKASQKLILAQQKSVKADADAKASWALKGALPNFTAEQKCADGGVEVTATNKGDAPFDFTLDGKKSTVKPGETTTQLVKVQEDQAYTIKIMGPDNQPLKEFTGVLDCKTASTTGGGGGTPPPASSPTPIPSAPASVPPAAGNQGPELAETGGSD